MMIFFLVHLFLDVPTPHNQHVIFFDQVDETAM